MSELDAQANIGFALQTMAQSQPDTPAVITLTRFVNREFRFQTTSYASLELRCAAMARGLIAQGVQKGDRVALLVPAGPTLYA